MPAKSKKQYKFMQSALHGGNKKVDKKVAEDFVKETPSNLRKLYSKK